MASSNDDDGLLVENDDDRDSLLNRNDNDDVVLNDHASYQRPRKRRRIRFGDALQHAGFGRFQCKLLLLCGWAVCGDAFQSLSASFVLRLATCEMRLLEYQQTWFSVIIYFGMMVGGLLCAGLADWHGRKAVLEIFLAFGAVFGLLTSFAQTFTQFLAFRFFTGVGVGASIPVIFSYFAEFQAESRRGSMLAALAAFWTVGAILTSGLAWLMVPYSFGVEYDYFRYSSWRIFLSLSSIPSLTAALLFFLMPESPKYLTETGRDDEAYQILQNVFTVNHPDLLPSEFENFVNPLIWNIDHMDAVLDSTRFIRKAEGFADSFCNFWRLYVKRVQSWIQLFEPSLRKSTLVMLAVFIQISFGYYGFLTWFREVFSQFKQSDGVGTVCQPLNYSRGWDPSKPCVPSELALQNKFLINIVAIPGCIVTIGLIDRIRRKLLLSIGLISSSVVFFFVWLISTGSGALAFCCIMNGLIVVSWITLNIFSVELFPTTIRCTAFGLLTAFSSAATVCGVAAFEKLVLANCLAPVLLIVALFVLSGLLGCLLPNTRSVDLK